MPLFRGKEPVAEGTIEPEKDPEQVAKLNEAVDRIREKERWIPWPFGDRTFCFRRSCSISS
jgi:hypothetical protein